jgi:2-dehydropantoate 2-reductase
MKILVYGAGVIGSVYAAYLHYAGHEVSILARGRRLADIREHGVVLERAPSGTRIEAKVPTVERLEPDVAYDLVLVVMQKGDLASVLPLLAANRLTPSFAFLGNNAAGPDQLVGPLGAERVLMGFPSFGGYFDGPVVRFASEGNEAGGIGLTLGELDGSTTPRLREISGAFSAAHIEVAIEPHIDAWLKGHVALVAPILFALNRHGSDNQALSRDRATLRLMARAVIEGLTALRELGYPITPFKLKTIAWLPLFASVYIFGKIIGSDFAKVAFVGHSANAASEFELLLGELRALIEESGRATPALDELCGSPIETHSGISVE